jgi:hypothetical protein
VSPKESDRATGTAHLAMTVLVNGLAVNGLDPRTLKMIAFLTSMDRRVRGMRQGKWTFDFGEVQVQPNLSESFDRV